MNIWILKRHVHVSWGIAIACVGIIVGVIWAQFVEPGLFAESGWLLTGIVLGAIGFWRSKVYTAVFLLLAGAITGLWRGSITQHELAVFDNLIDHTSTITGKVSEDPDLDEHENMVLRLKDLTIEGRAVTGMVWVSISGGKDIKRGDIVTVEGKLQKGFGSFAAALYRGDVERVQRPVPGDIAGQVRDAFAEKVRSVIPEPQASLGNGYLWANAVRFHPSLMRRCKLPA